MGNGIGEAIEFLFRLAGCSLVIGIAGVAVAVWAIFFR